MNIQVRTAQESDWAAIEQVVCASFGEDQGVMVRQAHHERTVYGIEEHALPEHKRQQAQQILFEALDNSHYCLEEKCPVCD